MDWCPFAVQRYGPAWKMGGYTGLGLTAPKVGEIKHSAVGFLPGIFTQLDGPAQVSWHFTISYDGTIYQHYPVAGICWHSGSARWNIDTVGIEHEGGAPGNESEPLRDAQVTATTRLTRWLAEQFGRTGDYSRYPDSAQWWLTEHRQIHATACPSGRIPWEQILNALESPQLPPVGLPTVAQVEHASPFLVVAYHDRDKDRIHPFDIGVLERAIAWWKGA